MFLDVTGFCKMTLSSLKLPQLLCPISGKLSTMNLPPTGPSLLLILVTVLLPLSGMIAGLILIPLLPPTLPCFPTLFGLTFRCNKFFRTGLIYVLGPC